MRLRFALTQAVSSLALLFTLALFAGTASAQQAQRVARVGGHPNINGVWQAMNTANWNLEGQSAEATEFWQLGALFAIPAGPSVVEGGTIPYLPPRWSSGRGTRRTGPPPIRRRSVSVQAFRVPRICPIRFASFRATAT